MENNFIQTKGKGETFEEAEKRNNFFIKQGYNKSIKEELRFLNKLDNIIPVIIEGTDLMRIDNLVNARINKLKSNKVIIGI